MNKAIQSLAVLEAGFSQGSDYIDVFAQLAAESIRKREPDVVVASVLQQDMCDDHGLQLPQSVVARLIERCVRQRLLRDVRGAAVPDVDALGQLRIEPARAQTVACYDRLSEALQAYAKETAGAHWSADDAGAALVNALSTISARGLGYEGARAVLQGPGPQAEQNQYVVGAFIGGLRESRPDLLPDLDLVSKALLLANAVYLEAPPESRRRFKGTTVYLDTVVLLRALGYDGPLRQKPLTEMLGLLRDARAVVACYQHTQMELRQVLERVEAQLSGRVAVTSSSRETIAHLREVGKAPTELALERQRLDRMLRDLGVTVVVRPAMDETWATHHSHVQEAIDGRVSYHRTDTLERDVQSVVATAQQRQRTESVHIEECRALFVTSNAALVAAANSAVPVERGSVPVCMTDAMLTVALWLRAPTQRPDLPTQRVLADCYAAIQPGEPFWEQYDKQLANLQNHGEVTEDEVLVLRYDRAMQAHLMAATHGDAALLTMASVSAARARVKAANEAEWQAKLNAAQEAASRLAAERDSDLERLRHAEESRADDTRRREEQEREQVERQREAISEAAGKWAAWQSWLVALPLALACLAAAFWPAVQSLIAATAPRPLAWGALIQALLTVPSLIFLLCGGSVLAFRGAAHKLLAAWHCRRLEHTAALLRFEGARRSN